MVVGGGDEDLGTGAVGGPLHRGGHGFGVVFGEAGDGRSGAAEPATEGTGFLGGGDHGIEAGDEAGAVGLVEGVAEAAGEGVVIRGGEGGGDRGGVRDVANGVGEGDRGREDVAGGIGLDFEVGDEEREVEARGDAEALVIAVAAGDDEAAEGGGGGVVGVAFELGAEAVDGVGAEGAVGELVEAVEDAEPDGDAAAEAAGARDGPSDFPREREGWACGGLEEAGGGGGDHRVRVGGVGAGDGDGIVETKGDAEGVEAGAEIGRGGGDANAGGGWHRGKIAVRAGRRKQLVGSVGGCDLTNRNDAG